MEREFLQKSLLIIHFRLFYQELIRLKGFALSSTLLEKKEEKSSNAADYIFNRLAELLSKNREVAFQQSKQNKAAESYYNEGLYIMVALADEVFLRLKWSGQKAWQEHLLEVHFFHTHKAGDYFFQKLDAFLQKNSAAHKDLASLYLWALGLNFVGKYDESKHTSFLKTYKQHLYALLRYGSKDAITEKTLPLFSPDAYKHVIRGTGTTALPSLQFWKRCLYTVVGCMVIISSLTWRYDMSEIRSILDATHIVEVSA